jgi:hypothetical protein
MMRHYHMCIEHKHLKKSAFVFSSNQNQTGCQRNLFVFCALGNDNNSRRSYRNLYLYGYLFLYPFSFWIQKTG